MMVMTAKVDKKKILLVVGAVAAVIVALMLLFGGSSEDTAPTGAFSAANNDQRVKFLTDFGWDVTNSPVESSQVRVPEEITQVYERYNTLQKSQGFDLSPYTGKNVMRYVYRINNYPGSGEPVYATILVYKNQIIGGDITDTAAKGHIQGFKMPTAMPPATTPTVPAAPTTPTTPAATDPT